MANFNASTVAAMSFWGPAAAMLMGLAGCAKVGESDSAPANTTEAHPPAADDRTAKSDSKPAASGELNANDPADEASGATTADAADQKSSPVVRGTVKFDGPPPERLEIDMTQVPECVKVHGSDTILNEDVILGPGGEVKNAFVYVKRAPEPSDDAPPEPAVLNQTKCMYTPRVQGIRVGQKLEIRNSDAFAHNVRGYPNLNPIFNIGQPGKGDVREKVFDLAENPPIKFKCDLHKWMTAYVFVMDHPYFAVTGDDGQFEIGGLPPGDYTLAVWHEKLGKDQQEITVDEEGKVVADFTLHEE